jgi:para-nitrobenzyl esterase
MKSWLQISFQAFPATTGFGFPTGEPTLRRYARGLLPDKAVWHSSRYVVTLWARRCRARRYRILISSGPQMTSRRTFLKQSSLLLAGAQFGTAAEPDYVIAETSSGKLRGITLEDIRIFKGIPYGGSPAGKNRFLPPTKPTKWSGVRDALAYGPTAPQPTANNGNVPAQGEDCLVLNVYTPSLTGGSKRPVMVWLHGGGFATGSGSGPSIQGANLARSGNAVIVTINHRLGVLGQTYLGEALGSDFAASGSVGIQDIVLALRWVRENISHFGGDSNLVTIFGQSGGGRKVATLMSMPSAAGLFHRAIIESGALLRLTTQDDAIRTTNLLLAELDLTPGRARELQNVPFEKLVAANETVYKKFTLREPGMVADTPMVDGKIIPGQPWDPVAPAVSEHIPLLIGWAHTEETAYDRPTPEKLALDEAGLKERVAKRVGWDDPNPLIEAYRASNPQATPWDLYILIATDHPRGAYTRELAKRKVAQGGAPAYVYRFDWETPEGGGHMRSPHAVEVPFVFENIKVAGPVISGMPEAFALSEKIAASWVAFARVGDPNTSALPHWPAYSAERRDTMLFNNESRVVQDPDRAARLSMDRVLHLS